MRKWSWILRGLLGGAAAVTLVACEEVEPPKTVDKTVQVAPRVDTPKVVEAPKVETPKVETPKIETAKVEAKKDEPEGDVKPRKLIDDARDALAAGELQRGLKLAKAAVQKTPNRSAAWNTLGRAQLKNGDRKGAIESFQKACELNPDSSYAENNLGLAFIYEGRWDEAVDALEEATSLAPVEGYMWNNLGMAYEHLDRLEEARDAYRKAAELKTPLASQNLARLQGVKTIRTAKAEVSSDATVGGTKVETPIDLGPIELDGGSR